MRINNKMISSKQVNNYIICIPTYKRYEMFKEKTLSVLEKNKISLSRIYIFVANKSEKEKYMNVLDRKYHSRIIIGKKGLKNQRNFISNYFPEGTCIVQLDDDIEDIVELYHPIMENYDEWINTDFKTIKSQEFRKKQDIKSINNLHKFIKDTFKYCINNNIYLWGIYPIANPYFMTYTKEEKLNFIVGPMFGIINRHDKDLKLTLDEKENSERTLQHYVKDGKVLRVNYISIITKYYKNKGGMQNEGKDRIEEAAKSSNILHSRYPNITKIYIKKSTGMPEIKLIK